MVQFFENSVYLVGILGHDRVSCINQCEVQHYPRDLSNLNTVLKDAVLLAPSSLRLRDIFLYSLNYTKQALNQERKIGHTGSSSQNTL